MPVLFELDKEKLFWPDPEEGSVEVDGKSFDYPPIVTNIEPLRFFYNGLQSIDQTAASIWFYRVLEYFSFFTNAAEMRRLRHDPALSDADFSKKLLDMVSRDEKGPLFKLLSSLIDPPCLARAQSDGIVGGGGNVNALCEAIYAFRNSIVHGKYSYGFALRSDSVLHADPPMPKWESLLRDLARLAIDRYGSRA